MGLQRETAGRGSLALYTQIVFATILERTFFKVSPSALSVLGTLIIVASAVYVAVSSFLLILHEAIVVAHEAAMVVSF